MRQITRKKLAPYRGKAIVRLNLHTETTLQSDPFYKQFKYFFLLLRAAGRLPYTRKKTGEFYCSIFSTSTLYTVFVISVLSYNIYFILTHQTFKRATLYDVVIRYTHWTVCFSSQMFSIIYTPLETLKIVTFMNNWRIFNVHFIKVTGSPLPTCYSCLIPLAIIASTIAYGTLLLTFSITTRLPKQTIIIYIIIFYMNLILMLYWYFVCLYISYTGKIFSDSLVKILKRNPNGQHISRFRHLWLELCDLSLELPNSMSMALTAVFSSLFILFVLYVFLTFQIIFDPTGYALYHHLILLFVTYSLFIGYCDGTYNVQQKLGVDIMRAVMSCKLLSLKEEARHEVELLLDCIEYNPPTMTLSGFFNINRYLLMQIISVAAEYMIVLLQFKLSDL